MSDLDWIKLGVGLPPLPSDENFYQHMAEYIDRCVDAKLSNMADLQEQVAEFKNDMHKCLYQQDILSEQVDELKRDLACIKEKTKGAYCDRFRFTSNVCEYELELTKRWAQIKSGIPDQEAKYTQLFTDILRVGGNISVSDNGYHKIRFRKI